MKFLYLLLKRIEAYFKNNILFFCVFVGLSVCTVLILVLAYVTGDPYIRVKQSDDITFKLMNAELFESDTRDDFNSLISSAKNVGEVNYYVLSSFPLDGIRITAFSNNDCANNIMGSDNSIFKGKSSFTEKEDSERALIAIVGKDSKLMPGDTADTPYGTFLIVGKNCSNRNNPIVPYGTFLSLTCGIPNTVSVVFENNLSKEQEENLLKTWKEQLPGHPFGHSKYNAVMDESFDNIKIIFVITVIALIVMMMTLNYFDSQNYAGDIIMRLTGATRFDVSLLSVGAKTIVVLIISMIALGIYDLLIMCGVNEISFFGKITPLEMRDRIILLALCIASTCVTVIPIVVKNILSNPFEIAQRRE